MAHAIPSEDMLVRDDNLGIDRLLIAGQPVPPDLLDAYRAATGDSDAGELTDDEHILEAQNADLGKGTSTGSAAAEPKPGRRR